VREREGGEKGIERMSATGGRERGRECERGRGKEREVGEKGREKE
jgi:hypothetical protein